MKNCKENRRGFTLVELIVVIAILVILAAILIPTVSGYINDSKAGVCSTNVNALLRDYAYKSTAQIASGGSKSETGLLEQAALDNNCTKSGDVYVGLCPSNGEYTLRINDDGTPKIICSVHGELSGSSAGAGYVPYNYLSTLADVVSDGSLRVNGNETLRQYMLTRSYNNNNIQAKGVDSTVPEGADTTVGLVVTKHIAAATGASTDGIFWNLQYCGIKDDPNNLAYSDLYFTTVDITKVDNNKQVACIRYDAQSGMYTVGKVTVGEKSKNINGENVKYKILSPTVTIETSKLKTGGDTQYDSYIQAYEAYLEIKE